MMNRNSLLMRTFTLLLAWSTGTAAAQTTLTGTAGGSDSWNDPANWSAGVPAGPIDAIVAAGIQGKVDDVATPTYSGSLTLEANATLTMAGAVGSENAVWGASGIAMNAGSKIEVNMNTGVVFPPITLLGDATLSSLFGASDWETDDYTLITGAHTLTLHHFNGHTVNLNAANGFSELILDTLDRWNLHARAAGSLGTGDVTINPRSDGRSASLFIDVDDAMADTATLFLNGTPGQGGFSGNGSDYVVMNANDTIAALWVYGVQQPEGTYTNSEAWLTGAGTLTVKDPVGPIGTSYCGPANLNSTGAAAAITAWGLVDVAKNDVRLDAIGLPANRFGVFLTGPTQGFAANFGGSQGNLCLSGAIGFYANHVGDSGAAGQLALQLDLTQTPTPGGMVAVQPGETWNFQAWFRDKNPGATSNFTDGVSIAFQ